jgi:TonB family protein
MPSPQDKGYFLELNESFLLAARTVTSGRPTAIEDMREASLDNKTAVSQTLSAVFPSAGPAAVGVVCSVRPRDRFFLLASEKETPKASSLAALRAFVGSSAFAASGPSELVGLDARTGLPLEGKPGSRWFVSGAPKEALSGIRTTLGEWKLTPSRMEVASAGFLGVVLAEQQRTKGAPVLVWEIGEAASDLFLVSAQGIVGVKKLPFGLDRVADSVQAELGMKSRGAATRIFFNEFYDFSEIGPKIASRVAGSLQPAIAEITGSSGAPAALICLGVASKQNWFSQQMAKALNLAPWQPDVTTWCSTAGLTFVDSTLQSKLSPTWLGLLGLMSAVPADRAETESAWHPCWSVDGVEREEKPRIAEVPAPAPAPVIVPAPVRVSSTPSAPKIVPPTPALFAAAPTPRPAPAPMPAKAPPAKAPVPAPAPAQPAPKQEREAIVRPAAPAPAPKAPVAPVRPAPTPAPVEAAPTPAAAPRQAAAPAAKPAAPAGQPAASRSFFKSPAFMAVVVVLVVVLGLGGFLYHKFAQQQAAAEAAQHLAEQQVKAEAEARKKAELAAKAEAEARKRTEEELAQKNAAAETLAKKALEEAKQREADANRILNGRGSLVIVTEPAGASIAVSNFAPRQSPATITDLRLGKYAVNVSLPGYDSLSLDVEVKDNAATDPGVIHLVRQTSSLEVTSEPAGASFEVRPTALQVSVGGAAVKTGKTPATVTDLPTGAYVATFRRDGWPDETQNVTLEHGKTAHVAWKYVGGSVSITTIPSGARVTRNGDTLGVTPLTLTDQQPGEMSFTLDLAGFISTTVEGKIEADKTLNLSANLGAEDRIVPLRELDERPVPIKMVKPELGYEAARNGGSAVISLMVDRDGTPKDLRIESGTDPDFAKRCLEAAAQWRFKPGSVKGVPVRTRVSLPFNL